MRCGCRSVSSILLVLGACSVAIPGQTAAQTSAFASVRARWENWDWFEAAADGSYDYFGVLVRAGVRAEWPRIGGTLEASAPMLFGLPADAVVPAPQGQLGLGAAYRAANRDEKNAAGLFVKQAFLRLGAATTSAGHGFRIGRFEVIDGMETPSSQQTLATLERERIAHRLIGNFGWSHAQRSFDGGQYTYNTDALNLSVVAARPTEGVFRTDGWDNLDVDVIYAALSSRTDTSSLADWRLFGMYYRDHRSAPIKADNRALAVRQADSEAIEVSTAGAHIVARRTVGTVNIDGLAWVAVQTGNWGLLEHRAAAVALELGAQFATAGKPWLRAGWNFTSGDTSPTDDRHQTFFALLPTPRQYARFPFFTNMNLSDGFLTLALTPHARVSLKADAHSLRLAESADGWYAGGGAFESNSFGYAIRPANGNNELATLLDISVQWRVQPTLSVNLYGGWARGGAVIDRIYPTGGDAALGYLEIEWRK